MDQDVSATGKRRESAENETLVITQGFQFVEISAILWQLLFRILWKKNFN